jgi:excisionase family DNA binding protein
VTSPHTPREWSDSGSGRGPGGFHPSSPLRTLAGDAPPPRLSQLAKPAHSFDLGVESPGTGQHALAPFDAKRADRKRLGFTVRELAERLHVSTATVYGWVKVGKLAHLRLRGNVIRIPLAAFERFVAGPRSGDSGCSSSPLLLMLANAGLLAVCTRRLSEDVLFACSFFRAR